MALGSTRNGVTLVEPELDRQFEAVRLFSRWDAPFPNDEQRGMLDAGRTVLLSIHPQRLNGAFVTWRQIIDAQPGDPIDLHIRQWAQRMKPYQHQLYVTFNHEPETTRNLVVGTAGEFRLAWQKVMTIFEQEGLVTKGRLYIGTSLSYALPTSDRRAIDHWYPGDAWVDAAGGDAYNFHRCRPNEQVGWRELATIIEGQRIWGQSHPVIDLMLPEFASVTDPDNPARRAEWLRNARTTLTNPAYNQFTLVSYYFTVDVENPNCDFVRNMSSDLQAFYDLANDPLFGGTGTRGTPPARCEWSPTRQLSWRASYEATAYRVMDGAALVQRTTELELLGLPDAQVGYRIIAESVEGFSAPTPCNGSGSPQSLLPPSTCSWRREAVQIVVTWPSAQGATEYVVHRMVDGRGPYWRGRVAATTFSDTSTQGALSYTVTSKAANGSMSASTLCGEDTPPAPAVSAPASCTVARDGGVVTVEWLSAQGAAEYVVHRMVDDRGPYWRGRVAEMTFSDSSTPGALSYTVTSKAANGSLSSATLCAELTPPPPALSPPGFCGVERGAGSITVTWSAVSGVPDYVVYRTVNGSSQYWQGRTAELTFVQQDQPGDIHYFVASRSATGERSEVRACVTN